MYWSDKNYPNPGFISLVNPCDPTPDVKEIHFECMEKKSKIQFILLSLPSDPTKKSNKNSNQVIFELF